MLGSFVNPIKEVGSTLKGAEDSVRSRVRENISARNGPYNYEPPEIPGPPVKEWLVPLGDTGIWYTPNDPVDPRDCEQWPNSPYCPDSPINPLVPFGQEIEITRTACEICVTVTSTGFFIVGPQYTICSRSKRPECQVELPQQEPPVEPNELGLPRVRTRHRCNNSLFVWTLVGADIDALNAYEISTYSEQRQKAIQDVADGFRGATNWAVTYNTIGPDRAIEMRLLRLPDSGGGYYYIQAQSEYPTNAATGEKRSPWGPEDYPLMMLHFWTFYTYSHDPDQAITFYPVEFHQVLEAPFPPCPEGPPIPRAPGQFTPPFVIPKDIPPMECNCTEMSEMLEAIYIRLGVPQFPVSLPDTIIENGSNAQVSKEDIPSIMTWLIEQIDAITGQFPIELEIEDTDPTTPGNQTQKISLPNISESLAELYSLGLKGGITGDIHTDMLLRLAAEVIATKNSSLITQDVVKANASFLGYRSNPKKRKINYAFDPSNLSDLTKVLTPTEGEIVGFTESDPETVVGFLQRIVFVSGLLKEVFFRNKERMPDLIDQFQQFAEDEDGGASRWEEYLRTLNDPASLANLNRPTPKAVDINLEDE